MEKSTKNVLIGIGVLSILAGLYGIYSKAELFNVFITVFIGLSLIVTVYLDKGKMNKDLN